MNTEEKEIKNKLFNVIPVGTLEMQQFLQILSIKFSTTETQSASVSCTIRPELILNPDFINQYCKTNEHLFMLVMHELYHIILGHTTLFNNHTIIDNIAFDAVINSTLCKFFPQEEYTSFFTQLNNSNKIPSCLLRPPADDNPQEAKNILNNLYNTEMGTYFEVYKALIEKFSKDIKKDKFILIGNHDTSKNITNNPILKETVNKIISKCSKVYKATGRRTGEKTERINIKYEKSKNDLKKKIKNFLRKAGIESGDTVRTKLKIQLRNQSAVTFIPNFFDRTITAKKMLMNNVLLYNQQVSNNQPIQETPLKAFVYLDVSGSVQRELQEFAPLLIKPYKEKQCLMFCFSDEVAETNPKDFIAGKFYSTGGTDINCMFKHFFKLPIRKRAKKIIVLTDGYTGSVFCEYKNLIKEKNIKVYCGLFGRNPQREDLKDIVRSFEKFTL